MSQVQSQTRGHGVNTRAVTARVTGGPCQCGLRLRESFDKSGPVPAVNQRPQPEARLEQPLARARLRARDTPATVTPPLHLRCTSVTSSLRLCYTSTTPHPCMILDHPRWLRLLLRMTRPHKHPRRKARKTRRIDGFIAPKRRFRVVAPKPS